MNGRKMIAFALCAGAFAAAGLQMVKSRGVLASGVPDWQQWGRNPQHTGRSTAAGQNPAEQLADITYDPFAAQEQEASGGELLIHYQVPLVDGNSVFLEVKSGSYNGPNDWNTQIWNERSYEWQAGSLVQQWNFQSDWKPEPDGGNFGLGGWEPVFHAALGSGSVYVPGFSGSVYELKETDGTVVHQFAPFGTTDPNTFVSGPLTIDAQGDVYYNAIQLSAADLISIL